MNNLSLRRKLLAWLLAPLCALLILDTLVTYATSVRFSNQAHDRALQEIAREVFLHLRYRNGQPVLEMPASTEAILMVDQDDRLHYQVLSAGGHVVAGNARITLPSGVTQASIAPGQKIFHDGVIGTKPVRVVTANMALKAGLEPGEGAKGFLVQVAETLNKRQRLATDILVSVVIPQVLLIILATLVVYYGVRQGLLPLQRLRSGVASRSHLDLSPIDVGRVPSEVRPLVDAVNDLLRRLSTTLNFQARFIADAAHQLKTPVAGIKAQIDLALREPAHADLRPAVAQMQASADRLSHLVGQLLSLARNEPSAVENIMLSPVDLHALTLDVTMQWVPKALERNVDLGFEAVPVPVFIDGDADRLRELINNLVDNAVRYTRDEGRVTVRVGEGEGARRTLSVSDDGPKIPLEERQRIFERFHRLLGTHTEGSGLGLAIVSEIAALHNASIVLEDDADGVGNTFTLFFPAPRRIPPVESLV